MTESGESTTALNLWFLTCVRTRSRLLEHIAIDNSPGEQAKFHHPVPGVFIRHSSKMDDGDMLMNDGSSGLQIISIVFVGNSMKLAV